MPCAHRERRRSHALGPRGPRGVCLPSRAILFAAAVRASASEYRESPATHLRAPVALASLLLAGPYPALPDRRGGRAGRCHAFQFCEADASATYRRGRLRDALFSWSCFLLFSAAINAAIGNSQD